MAEPAKIELTLDEAGRGTVRIDGVDVSNKINGITVVARVGHLTRVRLSFVNVEVGGEVATLDALDGRVHR